MLNLILKVLKAINSYIVSTIQKEDLEYLIQVKQLEEIKQDRKPNS